MEILIIVGIILLFLFLNSLPFIAGVLNTPSGSVFLGTVHWPGDYFYYLSQFTSGKNSWFTSYDLYTNDFPHKTLVGWVNVFLGHLFSLLEIDGRIAYQLSIVIFGAAFLTVSYLVIREVFPSEGRKRIIAFILFVTANAFPRLIYEGGKWNLSYYDYWYNNGIPFIRLAGVPHHLIARTVIVLAVFLAMRWWRKERGEIGKMCYWQRSCVVVNTCWFLILGFILASVEPIHWLLVVLVLFIAPLLHKFSIREPFGRSQFSLNFQSLKIKYLDFISNFKFQIKNYYPSLFLFLGGLPMAIYLKRLFAGPPYSQLAVWENSQQVNISLFNFIMANGPVMVLAIVGLLFYVSDTPKILLRSVYFFCAPPKLASAISRFRLKHGGRAQKNIPPRKIFSFQFILLIIFIFLTIGLFFSPLPRWVSIVNVRFLPAVTTLFLAIFATEAVELCVRVLSRSSPVRRPHSPPAGGSLRALDGSSSPRATRTLNWLFLLVILLVMIPTYFVQIQNRIKTDTVNSFYYVSQGTYDAFLETQKIGNSKDTFLVIWPFNWSFPGITGRRVYEGHSLLTTNYNEKELATRSFFFGDMSKGDMEKMLLREKIDYVVTYPWSRNINDLTNLEKVYDNGTLGIYKIKL